MIITPKDISSYLYCPVKYFSNKNKQTSKKDIWLDKIKEAIIKTEKRVFLHDSFITVKKINRVWDSVWWDYGFSIDMDLDKMKKLTVAASIKFSEYCKYDFSSDMFSTIAVDISMDKQFSSSIILKSNIDIIKFDITNNKKQLYLINIDKIDSNTIHTNIEIAARVLPFFINGCEEISYINVDFSHKDLKVTPYFFRKEDVDKYSKAIFYLARGIISRIEYPNMYNCKECGICHGISSIRE